jgi:hypothetical protein
LHAVTMVSPSSPESSHGAAAHFPSSFFSNLLKTHGVFVGRGFITLQAIPVYISIPLLASGIGESPDILVKKCSGEVR